MKKILILGGNSDIGQALIKKIINIKNINLHIHYNNKFAKKKYFNKIKLIKKNLANLKIKDLSDNFDNNYDIIVNLVGYISKQSFLNFSIEETQKTILINSLIPFLIIKNCIKRMIKKKYGRIINTSSIGVKYGGGLNTFSYSLSKHVNEFIPNEIRKLCRKNILYNTLKIGVTNTKFHKKIEEKSLRERIKLIPIKKMASTKDISDYIYYLIFHNNYIANEVINISGGE